MIYDHYYGKNIQSKLIQLMANHVNTKIAIKIVNITGLLLIQRFSCWTAVNYYGIFYFNTNTTDSEEHLLVY